MVNSRLQAPRPRGVMTSRRGRGGPLLGYITLGGGAEKSGVPESSEKERVGIRVGWGVSRMTVSRRPEGPEAGGPHAVWQALGCVPVTLWRPTGFQSSLGRFVRNQAPLHHREDFPIPDNHRVLNGSVAMRQLLPSLQGKGTWGLTELPEVGRSRRNCKDPSQRRRHSHLLCSDSPWSFISAVVLRTFAFR